MSVQNTFLVTDHAVDRFQERHARGIPRAEARAVLERLILGAAPARTKTHGGEQVWRVAKPPFAFVTRRDGNVNVVLTVLPPDAFRQDRDPVGEEAEELFQAYERLRAAERML